QTRSGTPRSFCALMGRPDSSGSKRRTNRWLDRCVARQRATGLTTSLQRPEPTHGGGPRMALSRKRLVDALRDLVRREFDALAAYDEAISGVRESVIQHPLSVFRSEHERRVAGLSAMVQRLGGVAPTRPDLGGVLRKTVTRLASLVGTEAVLMAMKSNEAALR